MKFLSYLFLLSIPLACGGGSNSSDSYTTEANIDYEFTEDAKTNHNNYNTAVQVENSNEPEKIIKNARLRFETQNTADTYNVLSSVIKLHNGFIQNDEISRSYDTENRYLDIRVPAEKFESLVDAISKNVPYFDEKSISSKDVTEEYIDIEARLTAKKTLENRYLELLGSAKNVSEILEIEKELANIRSDIESAQGRLKYLQNKVSLSTIHIEFYKTKVSSVTKKSYGAKMIDALVSGFNGLSIFILGILHIWPFILILIIGLYLLKRYLKKQKQ